MARVRSFPAALLLAAAVAAPASAAAPPFRIAIVAATHRPKANAKWPVTIRVTSPAGKPLAARLTMRILVGGSVVGKVDNGRVYRFVGSWRERRGQEITWPPAAVGVPVVFEAVVTVAGKTRAARYTVTVRR